MAWESVYEGVLLPKFDGVYKKFLLHAIGKARPNNHRQEQIRKPQVLKISDDEDNDEKEDVLKPAGEVVEKWSPSGGQVIDLLNIHHTVKPKGEKGFI